ncbi:hypothetical protein DB30_05263 [Enhygromyxa salina]|uniref:Peptidase M66 domain-containing protein n=1 Tax=Enhygromyxa salina TaxID=215803 RepID=A0A0C1ZXB4_9BACT|nr:hypothetical protein [Enhygromyxa salina]KIG15693.1 hypothetical protein DB30_05263 [Enhygromyxa salina]
MSCSTRLIFAAGAASLALMSLAAGCGDDTVAATDEAGDGDGDGDATETSTDTDEPPPPELGGAAMGISIVGIEANQGTAVALTNGVDYIGPDNRNAYLVRDRDTLIRFQHVIEDPAAWIDRDLTGFLHVYPADGGEEIISERKLFVTADSDPRNLDTNFYFSLLAKDAKPGARFWVELRESDKLIDVSGLSEGVSAAPAESQPFGFEDTSLELDIVIVPVDYQWPDPPRYPDITAEDLQIFHDLLLQQNPVQTINIQFRDEPLVWDERITNLGSLLGPTRALKINDGAAANVYYHALVDVGGSGVNMVAGIANLAGPGMNDSDRRVAATVYYKHYDPGDPEEGEEPQTFSPINSARTWVHEVGHNQGLSHVYCPGADSAGPDPSYPYQDGKIGVFGFGIRDYHMYTPTAAHDYMSYCGNAWVSDWTWNKTYERIQTLTSWNGGAAEPPGVTGQILVGMLFADGTEDWWVYDAAAPTQRSGGQTVEFWDHGQLVAAELAQVELLSDAETVVVTVPLPADGWDSVDAITRVDHRGTRRGLELGRIHRGRDLAVHGAQGQG